MCKVEVVDKLILKLFVFRIFLFVWIIVYWCLFILECCLGWNGRCMFGIKFVCFRILGRSGGDEGVEDEEGVGGIEEIGKVIGI